MDEYRSSIVIIFLKMCMYFRSPQAQWKRCKREREREREIAFSVRRRRIERIVTMYLYERNEKEEGRTV